MIGRDEPKLGITPTLRDSVLGRCVACSAWTELSPRTGECQPCHVERLDAGVRPLLDRLVLSDRRGLRRRIAGHAILGATSAWVAVSVALVMDAAGAADHVALLGVAGFALIALGVFAFGEALVIGQRLIGGSA